MILAAIIAGVWFYVTPGFEPIITFLVIAAGVLGNEHLKKKGNVKFSNHNLKVKGDHFESGRIIAGEITFQLEISNTTTSAITLNSASISVSNNLEKVTDKIPRTATMQNLSKYLEQPRQSITVEPNAFITLRVQVKFKASNIEKLAQAQAIGALAEKETCSLHIKYNTINSSKNHCIEMEFETSALKADTRMKYEENNDFQAVVCLVEPKKI